MTQKDLIQVKRQVQKDLDIVHTRVKLEKLDLEKMAIHGLFKKQKQDLKDGKALLEDIINHEIFGYRAPSFAINNDILKMIQDTGHVYDSSYNSFSMHKRYGTIDLTNNTKKGAAYKISDDFFELPISNLNINQKILNQNILNQNILNQKYFEAKFGQKLKRI